MADSDPTLSPSEVPSRDSLASHIESEAHFSQDELPGPERDEFFVYQRELGQGTRLENYEIERSLGGGGFGITYLARDILLNRYVVIKENFPAPYSHRDPLTGLIIPNNENDIENYNWALRSFLNEARTIAELDHSGIVKILSIFETNGTAYFAMDYIDGLSLEYLGERLFATGRRYSEDELRGLLIRLLDILSYLHGKGIFHRDIKPGNILLNREGVPVLIDFGAARHVSEVNSLTIMTTLGYSSPEQALGMTNVGPWSDLYSLGATFYALLTGEPPDRAEVRFSNDHTVPLCAKPELESLYSREFLSSIDKALSPDVAQRFQCAQEWMEALHTLPDTKLSTLTMSDDDLDIARQRKLIMTAEQAKGRPGSSPIATPAPDPKKSMPASCLTALVILLLLGGAVYMWLGITPVESIVNSWTQAVDWAKEKSNDPANEADDGVDAFDINTISVPSLSTPTDTPTETESIVAFSFPLSDSVLAQSGLPSVRPESLRISSISVLKDTTPAATSESTEEDPPVFLVIRRPDGSLVARSDNSIRLGLMPGRGNLSFSFPALPKLSSQISYTYSFESSQGEAVSVLVPMLTTGIPSEGLITSYPLVRFICGSAQETEESFSSEPEMSRVYETLTQPNEGSIPSIVSLEATGKELETIKAMAEAGYPEAQYKMYRLLLFKPSEAREAIEWLSRAAIGGYAPAQLELGVQYLNINRFIVDPLPAPPLAPQDYAQSARFLRMAIQHRNIYAIYLMGMLNSQGWGLPKSATTAKLLFYWASKLDSMITAEHIDATADIIGFWGSQYLKPNTPTTFRFPITVAQLKKIKSLRILSTGGLSPCTISDICIIRDNHVIAATPASLQLTPGAEPTPVEIYIPDDLTNEDALLEFKLLTSSANLGVIQVDRP